MAGRGGFPLGQAGKCMKRTAGYRPAVAMVG